MAVDRKLLAILCCPITHVGLEPAPRSRLHMLNLQIEAGRIINRGGQRLQSPLDEGLMTTDGRLLYPVTDGIPVLLDEEAIHLSQLDGVGEPA